ncbi:MAG: ATP-binding protein [Anaerofustis sp.]
MKPNNFLKKIKNKRDKIGIQWKLYFYLIGFVGMVIVVLWLFQIVFLNDFYKAIKISDVKKSADSIADNITNDNLDDLVLRLAQEYQICIIVMDSSGNQYLSVDMLPDCIIHKLSTDSLLTIYQTAVDNGGEYLQLFTRENFYNSQYDAQQYTGIVPQYDSGMKESIIYTKVITLESGKKVTIFINTTVTPLNSTVTTLRKQLIWITGILLLFALLLAYIISKKISRPIKYINTSAKVLAQGNYHVSFNGKGYQEITELSETLNYAASELGKVEQFRRELLANISHDLRTPITMITGYSEIMRDIPGENTPENVQIIIDEANRLTQLVNDLLDVSKMQSGTQSLMKETFSLTALIGETLDRYNKMKQQEAYILRFEHAEEVFVSADRMKISQVLYNLINNAIHYTGEDHTVIIRQTVSEQSVRVEVVDSGEGIAPDMVNYIWDRYYKIDKEHKRAVVGTGLGLSIVKTILQMHGAQYGVKSELGHGSNFWFELHIAPMNTVM